MHAHVQIDTGAATEIEVVTMETENDDTIGDDDADEVYGPACTVCGCCGCFNIAVCGCTQCTVKAPAPSVYSRAPAFIQPTLHTGVA